jgi:hypothetical protein
MPGFCFSNTDSVSGIIWPVISGLDTTATVTVPVSLFALALPALPEPPPLEHAAAAVTATAAHAAAASLRFLNLIPGLVLNLDEFINEPPPR